MYDIINNTRESYSGHIKYEYSDMKDEIYEKDGIIIVPYGVCTKGYWFIFTELQRVLKQTSTMDKNTLYRYIFQIQSPHKTNNLYSLWYKNLTDMKSFTKETKVLKLCEKCKEEMEVPFKAYNYHLCRCDLDIDDDISWYEFKSKQQVAIKCEKCKKESTIKLKKDNREIACSCKVKENEDDEDEENADES
jgi:hypothetical protein